MVWPIEGGRITQRFGPTEFTGEPAACYRGNCYPHFHDGLDIAAALGTPVRAIASGRVTLAGRVSDGAVVVMIEHSPGVVSLYGHLQPELAVREGESVVAGTDPRLGRADRQHDGAAPPPRDHGLGRAGRSTAHPAASAVIAKRHGRLTSRSLCVPDLLPVAGLLGAGTVGLAVGPRFSRLLRQRAYDHAVRGERLRWVLRLDPRTGGDPDAARRLVAGLHPGIRRGVSPWASGWPELTLAVTTVGHRARWEIEAPRQLRRLVETAVFAAFPDCELDLAEPVREIAPSVGLSVGGSPPEPGVGGSTPPRFGPALVELFARLPAGATARWTLVVRPAPDAGTPR